MKKALAFLLICSLSLIGAETKEKTLEELEAENKALEMQLKNERLKKEIEDTKNGKSEEKKELSAEEKKAEALKLLQEAFKEPTKDEKRSGTLWGFGIGGMAVTTGTDTLICQRSLWGYCASYTTQTEETNDVLFLLNSQLGGMTMWNRHFGVQYYTNLDVGFAFDFSKASMVATFNSDAIMNAYNSDSFGFGFLAGLGVGARMDYATGGLWTYGFDMRANLGIRAIFGSRHALDFMLAIPFTSTYDLSNLKENVSFSVRLTLGRF